MIKELNEIITDESFQQWLSGTASYSEMKKWDEWLQQSSNHQILHEEAVKLWKASKFRSMQQPNIKKEWQRIQHRMRQNEKHTNSFAFQPAFSFKRRHKAEASLRFAGLAFAAIIFIVLVFQFLPFQKSTETIDSTQYHYVETEYSQRATLKLPDGTNIILNAHSTLGYPAVWNEATGRTLQLQGEAYFDVTKKPGGPQKEFIVNTTEGQIKVLGTKFVVYERGNGTRVVVEAGKVEITAFKENLDKVKKGMKTFLKPGQLLHFDKDSKKLNPKIVNINPYITWWQKQFILDKTPFKVVVQRLEETYGVEVQVADQSLLERTLSGSIENRNLVVLTDALAYALKVSVQRNGQIIIFGRPHK